MAEAVIWRPQAGPQKVLIDCVHPEVFFGGARGGGKTDGVLGKWALKEARYGKRFNAIMFRKNTTAAEDAIDRAKEIYQPLGATFVASPRPLFKMPHGGKVRFGYLENVKDAEQFQGKNLTDAWTDEGGQYENPEPIDRLFGALRSSHGVPIQLAITANPGGPGQQWIASRYGLIPLPYRPKEVIRKLPDGSVHKKAVIPSRITDNKILIHSDPKYMSRLHLTGSANLVKAWLEGDWNAVDGAYFDCWNKHIVIKPFPIPKHWTRFRSYDWGTAAPFSVGWWAVSDGCLPHLPPGALIRYREWYGATDSGKGLRMTNKAQARGILARELRGEQIAYSVADPSIFSDKGGPTIAEDFATEGVDFIHGDNARIQGWQQLRLRMSATTPTDSGEGGQIPQPMVYCFSTCTDSIRTIPSLPHSQRDAEDVDTDAEDHIADEWRYALMSRPWVTEESQAPDDGDKWARIFDQDEGSDSWRT